MSGAICRLLTLTKSLGVICSSMMSKTIRILAEYGCRHLLSACLLIATIACKATSARSRTIFTSAYCEFEVKWTHKLLRYNLLCIHEKCAPYSSTHTLLLIVHAGTRVVLRFLALIVDVSFCEVCQSPHSL